MSQPNTMTISVLERELREHQDVYSRIESLFPAIEKSIASCVSALSARRKIMLCGNGGSAADAQHIAAELTGRYRRERRPLAGLALTTDSSALTCISNDYNFDHVFSRQLEALGVEGDILIAISTSGNSENVIQAVQVAKKLGVRTIGLLGRDGGKLADVVDQAIIVPSNTTARIQEVHIFIGHAICEGIDNALAPL